jgi:copper chaperone
MTTIKFLTNINCDGCVAKVRPFLDKAENIEKWEVDTANPDKILTVSGENLNKEKVKEIVKNAGFIIKGDFN